MTPTPVPHQSERAETPRTDEALAIEQNFGAIRDAVGNVEDAVTPEEAHNYMVSALTRLARTLERELAAERAVRDHYERLFHATHKAWESAEAALKEAQREALERALAEAKANDARYRYIRCYWPATLLETLYHIVMDGQFHAPTRLDEEIDKSVRAHGMVPPK
jgi:hypothetical protein